MTYVYWLAGLSVAFVLIERLRPRHVEQKVLRKGIATDAFYLIFNGHFLGVGLASVTTLVVARFDVVLQSVGINGVFYANVAESMPIWLQFVLALLAVDFTHWCVHNLMHRLPVLWQFHKVHHSIEDMDWAGSMRFHWMEVVVYKSLTYPVLAWFGFDGSVLMGHAVVATAAGHFNHANLNVSIGPLKYLLNNPAMHVWHHVHCDHGSPLRNFGITLSVWDWIFGTGHIPDQPPARLGFPGIEAFPSTVPGQLVHPLPVEQAIRDRSGRS